MISTTFQFCDMQCISDFWLWMPGSCVIQKMKNMTGTLRPPPLGSHYAGLSLVYTGRMAKNDCSCHDQLSLYCRSPALLMLMLLQMIMLQWFSFQLQAYEIKFCFLQNNFCFEQQQFTPYRYNAFTLHRCRWQPTDVGDNPSTRLYFPSLPFTYPSIPLCPAIFLCHPYPPLNAARECGAALWAPPAGPGGACQPNSF